MEQQKLYFSSSLSLKRSDAVLIKPSKRHHHLMCHLHSLHLLFYLIIIMKRLFCSANFCAVCLPLERFNGDWVKVGNGKEICKLSLG
jgi:hypothetical protein